jgi:hypothetical protein
MIRKRMIGVHVKFGDPSIASFPETACQFLIV